MCDRVRTATAVPDVRRPHDPLRRHGVDVAARAAHSALVAHRRARARRRAVAPRVERRADEHRRSDRSRASPSPATRSRPRPAPGAPPARRHLRLPLAPLRPRGWRRLVRQDVRHDRRRDTQSYTLVSADIGKRIRVRVSASSKGGTTAGDERRDVRRRDPGRQAGELVRADDLGQPGRRIDAVGRTGPWVGDAPITYSYQWLRCDPAGMRATRSAARTKSEYTPVDRRRREDAPPQGGRQEQPRQLRRVLDGDRRRCREARTTGPSRCRTARSPSTRRTSRRTSGSSSTR